MILTETDFSDHYYLGIALLVADDSHRAYFALCARGDGVLVGSLYHQYLRTSVHHQSTSVTLLAPVLSNKSRIFGLSGGWVVVRERKEESHAHSHTHISPYRGQEKSGGRQRERRRKEREREREALRAPNQGVPVPVFPSPWITDPTRLH